MAVMVLTAVAKQDKTAVSLVVQNVMPLIAHAVDQIAALLIKLPPVLMCSLRI